MQVYVLDLEGIDDLDRKTDALDETVDQKADREDLDAKVGKNMLFGILVLLFIVWCGVYYMNRHDLEELKGRVQRLRKRVKSQ